MGHRRRISWIGLLLAVTVALHGLLPFYASYRPSGMVSMPSVFGEKILICTAAGFAWVSRADLAAGKVPVAPHKTFFCPLCYFSSVGVFDVMMAAAVMMLLRLHYKATHSCDARRLAPRYAYARPCTRAPPF